MKTDEYIKLLDGRRLGYAEYGDPNGSPLFFFHGFPGSRFEIMPLDNVFSRLGLRVLAPDRPGIGLSTFKRDFSFLGWPDDVIELSDRLGIGRFGVAGASGGGPFCLACAHKIPERLTTVTVIAGLGPLTDAQATAGMTEKNLRAFEMARKSPWKLRLIYFCARFIDLDKAHARSLANMPEPDRLAMERPEMRHMAALDARAAMAQGGKGLVQHVRLYAGDWGFELDEIEKDVDLWQGESDVNVPPAMGRFQAEHLRHCVAHFLPGEGHYSLPFNQAEAIFGIAARG